MQLATQQLEQLRAAGRDLSWETRSDGTILVTIPHFKLREGWSKPEVTVYFVIPVGYPMAKPDCFWTDDDLRLRGGALPTNTTSNTNYGGPRNLLWFSYHATFWEPNKDNVETYLRIIKQRLDDVR